MDGCLFDLYLFLFRQVSLRSSSFVEIFIIFKRNDKLHGESAWRNYGESFRHFKENSNSPWQKPVEELVFGISSRWFFPRDFALVVWSRLALSYQIITNLLMTTLRWFKIRKEKSVAGSNGWPLFRTTICTFCCIPIRYCSEIWTREVLIIHDSSYPNNCFRWLKGAQRKFTGSLWFQWWYCQISFFSLVVVVCWK